jgi:guanylate kinase
MQLAEQVRQEQESRREIQEEVRNWERVGARLHGQVQDVHIQLQQRIQELKNTRDELQQYRDQTEVRGAEDLVSLYHHTDILLFDCHFMY